MKRILAVMMSVLLIISLVGCGEENPLSDNVNSGQGDREYEEPTDLENKDDQENSRLLDEVEDVLDKIIEDKIADDYKWKYEDGTLTLSGHGRMPDYSYDDHNYTTDIPWYNHSREITKVIIKEGLTSIGERSFFMCTELTSIVIPDSITKIGMCSFASCDSLKSIEIPDSVISIGTSAFGSCSSLESIIIPDSVTNIGGNAFCYCDRLTSLFIPKSVTSIGNNIFFNCKNVITIHAPADSYAEQYAKENNIPFEAE